MAYANQPIWVAVDCLIFGYDLEENRLKLLLFPRKVEPQASKWSLIGGITGVDEDIEDTASRILKEATGLHDIFLEQLRVFGKANRDPGGRVVSVLYWSLIKLDLLQHEIVKAYGAHWFNIDQLPALIFDHADMVEEGMGKLTSEARNKPIGFELLPKKFTLPQLKSLYDAIHHRTLDDRNFRKKMLSTGLLDKTGQKDRSTSKKGAFLYQFNIKKYQELAHEGFYLDFSV